MLFSSALTEEQKCLSEAKSQLEKEKISFSAGLSRAEEEFKNRIHIHEENMANEITLLAQEREQVAMSRDVLKQQEILLEKEREEINKERLAFEEEKSQFRRYKEGFQKNEKLYEEEKNIIFRRLEEKEEERKQMEKRCNSMEGEAKIVMEQKRKL